MSLPVRIALVIVGIAAVLCGAACLTGGCGSPSRDEERADVSGTWTYSSADTRTLAGLAPDAPLSALLDLVPTDGRERVRPLLRALERGYRVRLTGGELIVEADDAAHPGSWRYQSSGRYEYKSGVLRAWSARVAGKEFPAERAKVSIVRVGADRMVWSSEAGPEGMGIPFEIVYRREPTAK